MSIKRNVSRGWSTIWSIGGRGWGLYEGPLWYVPHTNTHTHTPHWERWGGRALTSTDSKTIRQLSGMFRGCETQSTDWSFRWRGVGAVWETTLRCTTHIHKPHWERWGGTALVLQWTEGVLHFFQELGVVCFDFSLTILHRVLQFKNKMYILVIM